jgi:hypothetical protein
VNVPDTPEKNGIVKRPHTIQEKARVMMQEPKFRVVYWHGRKIDVNQLRICDCIGWVLAPKKCRKEGDLKSRECIVGCAENSKAYHLIDPEKPTTVITEENMKFVECSDRNTPMMQKNDKKGVIPYLNP